MKQFMSFLLFCIAVSFSLGAAAGVNQVQMQEKITAVDTPPTVAMQWTQTGELFSVDVEMNIANIAPDIVAVKLYLEPSHTLLLAWLHQDHAEEFYSSLNHARSLMIGDTLKSIHARIGSIDFPETDDRVAVTYLTEDQGKIVENELVTIKTGFIDGAIIRIWHASDHDSAEGCWVENDCPGEGTKCGPIWCDPCTVTTCCNPCRVMCGSHSCF